MKELFLLVSAAVGAFPVFIADTFVPEIYSPWIQAGAASVVCGLFVYLIVRSIPQENAANREALKDIQEGFVTTLRDLADRFERMEAARQDREDQLRTALLEVVRSCPRNQ